MRAWALLFLIGAGVEYRALRGKGMTLSSTTRLAYRVETRLGRLAFLATMGWFTAHILRRTTQTS